MAPKIDFYHTWSRRDLDLVISKSSQFTFVSQCTKIANFAKLYLMVYKIKCSQTFVTNTYIEGQTAPKILLSAPLYR